MEPDPDPRVAARAQLVAAMQAGQPWDGAAQAAALPLSRTAAYRLRRRFEQDGPAALPDGRPGHPRRLLPPARAWLFAFCRAHPAAPAREVQAALYAPWGLLLSRNYLNRLRARDHLRATPPPATTPPAP